MRKGQELVEMVKETLGLDVEILAGPCEGHWFPDSDVLGVWGGDCPRDGVPRPHIEDCPILCDRCNREQS